MIFILTSSFILKMLLTALTKKKLLESLVSFGILRKIERLVKMTLEGSQAKVSGWENKCPFYHR
jgi:hypothetical protein